ncbi:transmembrane 7 superfamily member 3-like [Watersipora subatra]|uniref:transmembrane 7 superfamily member 3-like n=1 Tax=Watersipora subatra TaxID=2589382 RepID=UPI00355B58AD
MLLLLMLCAAASASSNVTLSLEGTLVKAELAPHSPTDLFIQHTNTNYSDFYVPQCHARKYNFTLATGSTKETSSSVGNDIFNSDSSMTLINDVNNESIPVYCVYTSYNISAPVPGGCNLEFNFENDPNIHSWYDGFRLWLEFQYASVKRLECDDQKGWDYLTYSVYAIYLQVAGDQDTNFSDMLRDVITPAGIESKGTKIIEHTQAQSNKPALVVTSYPDQGVFIAVIVEDKLTGHKSAYVPRVSYGCDIDRHTSGHPCQVQWYYYLLAAVITVAGLFITFLGHRFFAYELFIMGFLTGLLCGFIGLLAARVSVIGLAGGSTLIGLAFGLLWALLWQCAGVVLLCLILPAANGGFLIASIITYSPLVNIKMFDSWELWLIGAAIMVFTFLAIVIWSKKVNIVICSFLGAYAIIATISVYCGASLHHIVIETVRRASVKEYSDSVFSAPFSVVDGVLVGLWATLTVVGYAVQFYTEKSKPDFPVSPRKKRLSRKLNAELEERERLLNDPNIRNADEYGTLHT